MSESERKRIRVFFCNDGNEVSCDLTVTPKVRVTRREDVTQIAIGPHDLELTLPNAIFEQITR